MKTLTARNPKPGCGKEGNVPQSDDFPFDMADVMGLLSLNHRKPGSDGWYVDCPFCGDTKRKMHINLKKKVFRCNRCGEYGGMLGLYAGMYGIDTKEAYDEIMELLHKKEPVSADQNKGKAGKEKSQNRVRRAAVTGRDEFVLEEKKGAALAPPEVRNRTYSHLLSSLVLAETHRDKLLDRGFTMEQISACNFHSTPVFGYKKLAKRLLEAGCILEGVPGFYQEEDGSWNINFNSRSAGILVPVCDLDGNIQGMQIRLDRPVDGCKYFWLSSIGLNSGVTSGSPIHFIGNVQDKTVYVTEGGLKGDLAHYQSGRSFLCLPGVNQYVNLPETLAQLRKQGVRKIYEAFDMDKLLRISCGRDNGEKCITCEHARSNGINGVCPKKELKRKNIQNGCRKLQSLCSAMGFEFIPLVWDRDKDGNWAGNIKGVDDYLVSLNGKK